MSSYTGILKTNDDITHIKRDVRKIKKALKSAEYLKVFNVIASVWPAYDRDNSGKLDREECLMFIKDTDAILTDNAEKFDEEAF